MSVAVGLKVDFHQSNLSSQRSQSVENGSHISVEAFR